MKTEYDDEVLTHELLYGGCIFLGLNKKGGLVTNERNIISNSGVEKNKKGEEKTEFGPVWKRVWGSAQK